MKYLRRYNESAQTDSVEIIKDILADLKDMGAEGRTELYWVPKDYKPNEGFQTTSRVEFANAIRLYWTEFEIPVKDEDFESIIEIMKEMIEVRSKLRSLSDDVYFRWKTFTAEDSDDSDRYGKKYLHFTIKLKKHDEVSTKDPQSELVSLIKPFCDKNAYKIEFYKNLPDFIWVRMDKSDEKMLVTGLKSAYDKYVESRYEDAGKIYDVIAKLVSGKVDIKQWEPDHDFFNLESLKIFIV